MTSIPFPCMSCANVSTRECRCMFICYCVALPWVNPFFLYMPCSIERVYPPVGCACARVCLHTWECVFECVCTRVPHTWEFVFECVCTRVPPHMRVHLRVRVFLLRIFIGLQAACSHVAHVFAPRLVWWMSVCVGAAYVVRFINHDIYISYNWVNGCLYFVNGCVCWGCIRCKINIPWHIHLTAWWISVCVWWMAVCVWWMSVCVGANDIYILQLMYPATCVYPCVRVHVFVCAGDAQGFYLVGYFSWECVLECVCVFVAYFHRSQGSEFACGACVCVCRWRAGISSCRLFFQGEGVC